MLTSSFFFVVVVVLVLVLFRVLVVVVVVVVVERPTTTTTTNILIDSPFRFVLNSRYSHFTTEKCRPKPWDLRGSFKLVLTPFNPVVNDIHTTNP